MRLQGPGFEFGVKLAAQKPGMPGQFDDLHQVSLRILAADAHAAISKQLLELGIEFVPMAVSFRYFFLAVNFKCQRFFCKMQE